LPEDGGVRPLRPDGAGVHVGADGSSQRPSRRRRYMTTSEGVSMAPSDTSPQNLVAAAKPPVEREIEPIAAARAARERARTPSVALTRKAKRRWLSMT